MITIGIDTGKTGAIAVIDGMNMLGIRDTPLIGKDYDERTMAQIIKGNAGTGVHIWLEKVHAMPKQGVVSMFTFGMGYGIWKGILAMSSASYHLVAPQTWKKYILKDFPKTKEASIVLAKQIFPEANNWLTLKKHHGRAEALLIAYYGYLHSAVVQKL